MYDDWIGKQVKGMSTGTFPTERTGILHKNSGGYYIEQEDTESPELVRHVYINHIELLPEKTEAEPKSGVEIYFDEKEMEVIKGLAEMIPAWVLNNFYQHVVGLMGEEKAVLLMLKLNLAKVIEPEVK